MNRILALAGACAAFATGIAVGVLAVDGETTDEVRASSASVRVKSKDGVLRELTALEAAARIERLESLVERATRARAVQPDLEDEAEDESASVSAELPDVPIPKRQDGRQYSFTELRELARTSTDPVLRLAAIRALRRDDSPEARSVLGELLTDAKTPAELRVEAAKALAKPPHRDASPADLVAMLSATDLPADVRRELADGVVHLRDRGAWMQEIAAQMTKETDSAVRSLLFDAVQRSAWDPAAKSELLALASNQNASIAERRLAAQALIQRGADRKVMAALAPLLSHTDAGLREAAVQALARGRQLTLDQFAQALADGDAGVRAAAMTGRLPQGKSIPKAERDAALATAAHLAVADPDATVRRTALSWVDDMPKETRTQVLEAARNDRDPLVQLDAYARSPQDVRRSRSDLLFSQLESPDARVRDAAFRVVARTWSVDVPFRAQWNPKARAAAIAAIRQQVATQ